MVTIDEVYGYIKEGNVSKVQEYLDSVATSGSVFLKKLNNFMSAAINYKQLNIIKLLISYGADPSSLNNINLFMAIGRNSIDNYNYLLHGRTYQEYLELTKSKENC